jgi:type IV pilus assembly protein PilW
MTHAISKYERGFSLTELMVAIVIGLVILAGVSSVMVSSKKTYTAQDSLARLQENARATMLILTQDMRNIGYWGCNPDKDNVHNALKSSASIGASFWFGKPLEGADAAGNLLPSGITISSMLGVTPKAGTDLIMIRGLDTGDAFSLDGPMNSQSASLKVKEQAPFKSGEVLVVTDCNSADIFQVTNVNTGGGFDNLIHNSGGSTTPGNASGQGGKLSKPYGDDAKVMRYKAHTYFIAPGASGEPSLWRQTLSSTGSNFVPTNQELVEGIENLQILYGLDTDGDNLPNNFVKAATLGTNTANWENVVSIRFGIIARALANLDTRKVRTAATASQLDTRALDIDGDGVYDFTGTETSTTTIDGETVLDRQYQRRMFRTTVLLRNMQIGK